LQTHHNQASISLSKNLNAIDDINLLLSAT
jgi:hypothetical protein